MEQKKAVIFGVGGQDGSYLSEYLLSLGYNVFGMIRRNSTPEHQESRISHLENKITTVYGDITDFATVYDLLKLANPDEIYNLAAQSHVRISFDVQQFTTQTNSVGVLNILESVRRCCPNAKLLQASSSEMFGNSIDADGYQRETTPMKPVSPYGCSKLYAYNIARIYRDGYKMNVSNSICFNHESPRRGSNFVTNKIIKAAVRIKLGLQKEVELGNIFTYRDWGHSKDYVRAMHLILQQEPGDYVVSTGESHSVYELIRCVEETLDIEIPVLVNEKFKRPHELQYLKGDSSRIRALGWKPEYTFKMLVDEMIHSWMVHYGAVDDKTPYLQTR